MSGVLMGGNGSGKGILGKKTTWAKVEASVDMKGKTSGHLVWIQ